MDSHHIAHLAGVFDAAGSITAHILKGDTSIGYRYEPMVRLHRPTWDTALLGKLGAYSEDQGINYTLVEKNDDRMLFEVKTVAGIEGFLEPMLPYFVTKHDEAALMLTEILPRIENDEHLTKPGFHRLMGYTDELRKSARHGPDPTYTQAYFTDLWGDEFAEP